jgi:hypothetical protein
VSISPCWRPRSWAGRCQKINVEASAKGNRASASRCFPQMRIGSPVAFYGRHRR